jgi:hypothetical protein
MVQGDETMPGTSRKDIIREGEIATYHIWSQTALQRFLLGRDYGLQQNNEHRRAWCDSLLNHLAKVFVIDVGSFDPLDNHFHLILRSRPDLVLNLTDEEVAFRWRQAWPKYNRDNNEWHRNPTDAEIEKLLMNPDKLLQARANLSSVSWFVGRFKECLSKLANAEVGTKGHFWAERFGSRELVDDPAVCIAMLYTDLNQVRAGMASSLQESMYATIQARIIENRLKEARETLEVFHQREGDRLSVTLAQLQDIYLRCSWVAPIDPHGDLKLINDAWNAYMLSKGKSSESSSRPSLIIGDSQEQTNADESEGDPSSEMTCEEGTDAEADAPPTPTTSERPRTSVASSHDSSPPSGPAQTSFSEEPNAKDSKRKKTKMAEDLKSTMKSRAKKQPIAKTYEIHNRLFPQLMPRASNSPILAMPLEQYLRLAEAAAERAIRLRGSKSSSDSASSTIPDDVAEILRNFGIHCEEWYATLDAFHERFYHIVGSPAHVAEMVARRGKQHAFGINACREVFRDIPATPAEPTEDTDAATPTTCGATQPGHDTPHDAEFS